jgi:hypothetical protein
VFECLKTSVTKEDREALEIAAECGYDVVFSAILTKHDGIRRFVEKEKENGRIQPLSGILGSETESEMMEDCVPIPPERSRDVLPFLESDSVWSTCIKALQKGHYKILTEAKVFLEAKYRAGIMSAACMAMRPVALAQMLELEGFLCAETREQLQKLLDGYLHLCVTSFHKCTRFEDVYASVCILTRAGAVPSADTMLRFALSLHEFDYPSGLLNALRVMLNAQMCKYGCHNLHGLHYKPCIDHAIERDNVTALTLLLDGLDGLERCLEGATHIGFYGGYHVMMHTAIRMASSNTFEHLLYRYMMSRVGKSNDETVIALNCLLGDAVTHGRLTMFDMLVSSGARMHFGHLIVTAADKGQLDMYRHLNACARSWSSVHMGECAEYYRTCLHVASKNGHVCIVKEIVPRSCPFPDMVAIRAAVDNYRDDIVSYLVDKTMRPVPQSILMLFLWNNDDREFEDLIVSVCKFGQYGILRTLLSVLSHLPKRVYEECVEFASRNLFLDVVDILREHFVRSINVGFL